MFSETHYICYFMLIMIPGSLQIRYWQLFSLSDHENRSHVEF